MSFEMGLHDPDSSHHVLVSVTRVRKTDIVSTKKCTAELLNFVRQMESSESVG